MSAPVLVAALVSALVPVLVLVLGLKMTILVPAIQMTMTAVFRALETKPLRLPSLSTLITEVAIPEVLAVDSHTTSQETTTIKAINPDRMTAVRRQTCLMADPKLVSPAARRLDRMTAIRSRPCLTVDRKLKSLVVTSLDPATVISLRANHKMAIRITGQTEE